MDRNTNKIPTPVDKEKIKVERVMTPFVVSGIFDNGASYTNKKVVVMACCESDAKAAARRHLEKHSDDYFKVESVKIMTANDVIVEDC
jgi:hypothetical protein